MKKIIILKLVLLQLVFSYNLCSAQTLSDTVNSPRVNSSKIESEKLTNPTIIYNYYYQDGKKKNINLTPAEKYSKASSIQTAGFVLIGTGIACILAGQVMKPKEFSNAEMINYPFEGFGLSYWGESYSEDDAKNADLAFLFTALGVAQLITSIPLTIVGSNKKHKARLLMDSKPMGKGLPIPSGYVNGISVRIPIASR